GHTRRYPSSSGSHGPDNPAAPAPAQKPEEASAAPAASQQPGGDHAAAPVSEQQPAKQPEAEDLSEVEPKVDAAGQSQAPAQDAESNKD
ncbi:MAG TPA: hypothetical protein DHV61_13670, partial [Glutamicibacter sp.]|nr:hypothetical protein [Glutamicibacter sp.]